MNPKYLSDPQQALKETFAQVQKALEAANAQSPGLLSASGTTATVALHRNNTIYLSYLGDSRAVYYLPQKTTGTSRYSSSGTMTSESSFMATADHTPDRPAEHARIESLGGEIKRPYKDSPWRLYRKGNNEPGIAMSRAFGDLDARSCGLSCEPEIAVIEEVLPSEDKEKYEGILLIASDGVWSELTNEEVGIIVRDGEKGAIDAVTKEIVRLSSEKWKKDCEGVVDDITIIAYRVGL